MYFTNLLCETRHHTQVATQILQCHEEDPGLLDKIVTGNKTWMHHSDPKSKSESMVWKHPGLSGKKQFRSVLFAKKILLTFFWDMKGTILEHYQAKGQTVNRAAHSAVLKDKLKPAIYNKSRGLLSKTVVLHHDNAHPHVMAATIETI
jgi:hypothetical protein